MFTETVNPKKIAEDKLQTRAKTAKKDTQNTDEINLYKHRPVA
jgi:hypothetical protein